MTKAKIIATGGLSRSGTNYCNYFFFLHPRIKPIGYLSQYDLEKWRELFGPMDIEFIHKKWTKTIKPAPTPFFKELRWDDSLGPEFEKFHQFQNEKQEFDAICFKADFGENWFHRLLPKQKDRALVIYCIRDPIKIYQSWKKWGRYKNKRIAKQWFEAFENTINDSYLYLRYSENGLLDFMPIYLGHSHEEIFRRLTYALNHYVGMDLGDLQAKFMEKRRPLVTNLGLCDITQSEDELLKEILEVGPDFEELKEKYLGLADLVSF